jgi:hypothetical protein
MSASAYPPLVTLLSSAVGSAGGALGAYQKAEIEKWWPIIKAVGLQVE